MSPSSHFGNSIAFFSQKLLAKKQKQKTKKMQAGLSSSWYG